MKSLLLINGSAAFMPFVCACAAPRGGVDRSAEQRALELLMPSRVEIVEPFTRVESFDDDPRPDGIELLVQSVDALDNPGLMPGRLDAALYGYVAASAEPKGRRLEHWVIDLTTPRQQRAYWNSMTQMYEFRLGIDPSRIPPAEKYVLAVVYTSPLGQRLSDECLIHYEAPTERLGRRSAP